MLGLKSPPGSVRVVGERVLDFSRSPPGSVTKVGERVLDFSRSPPGSVAKAGKRVLAHRPKYLKMYISKPPGHDSATSLIFHMFYNVFGFQNCSCARSSCNNTGFCNGPFGVFFKVSFSDAFSDDKIVPK